ncbi:MAG TPA: phosphotransferase [Chroococcales cyanobacterium]
MTPLHNPSLHPPAGTGAETFWKIDAEHGQYCLKFHRPGKTSQRASFEEHLQQLVYEASPPVTAVVPRIIPTLQGALSLSSEHHRWWLEQYVDGFHRSWFDLKADGLDCRTAGRALKSWHEAVRVVTASNIVCSGTASDTGRIACGGSAASAGGVDGGDISSRDIARVGDPLIASDKAGNFSASMASHLVPGGVAPTVSGKDAGDNGSCVTGGAYGGDILTGEEGMPAGAVAPLLEYCKRLLLADTASLLMYAEFIRELQIARTHFNRWCDRLSTLDETVDTSALLLAHGDFHPGNFILCGRQHGVIIDFEHVRTAEPLYDVGYSLVMFNLGRPADMPVAQTEYSREFLNGYLPELQHDPGAVSRTLDYARLAASLIAAWMVEQMLTAPRRNDLMVQCFKRLNSIGAQLCDV